MWTPALVAAAAGGWLSVLVISILPLTSSSADVHDDNSPKIYMYELPDIMNKVLTGGRDGQWRTIYKADMELHDWFSEHPSRTLEPCEADLFFLPIHGGQLVMNSWTGEPLDFSKYDNRHRWMGDVVLSALNIVKTSFAFWNASNGADHFTIMTSDHGRCDVLPLVPLPEVGEMVIISTKAEVGRWRSVHNPIENGTEMEFQCFQYGHDIPIPLFYSNGTAEQPTPPESTDRNISVLLRFNGDIMHRHGIRKLVLDLFQDAPFQGHVVLGNASIEQTDEEMQRSIFCFCPPGLAQHTGRFYRSIFHGCVPVTFFTDVDLPFSRISGVDYSSFVVNLDIHRAPAHMPLIVALLEDYLASPVKLESLQASLAAAQHMFNWDRTDPSGVQATVFNELSILARNVSRRYERVDCNAAESVTLHQGRMREQNEIYWADPIENNPYRLEENGTVITSITGDLDLPY